MEYFSPIMNVVVHFKGCKVVLSKYVVEAGGYLVARMVTSNGIKRFF